MLIKTSMGNMTIQLYDETPLHRDNFVKLVKQAYYKDLLFHRVIKDFMIQGGDPSSRNAPAGYQLGNGGPGYTIPAEFNPNFYHKKGALAAARMGDNVNPKKESSGSQFYIVQGRKYNESQLKIMSQQSGFSYTPEMIKTYETIGGTPHLDGNYTVFGELISGYDVLDAIANTQTQQGDRPVVDVKMDIEILK